MKKTYQPLVETIGKGRPYVGIVGAMHGNESGPQVIVKLKQRLVLRKGTITFIIANTKARETDVRFIDEDLNRAFPGKKDGTHEQRLAHKLIAIGKDFDYLIDLHSCSRESAPFAIIRSITGMDMTLAKKSGLPFIVVYPLSTQGGGSFIDNVKCGIGLELGKHKKRATITAGVEATLNILHFLGVAKKRGKLKSKQKILQVSGHILKEKGFRVNKLVENFRHIKKGQEIGKRYAEPVRADRDFYPVLCKEKAYTTNFGWMAEEIDV